MDLFLVNQEKIENLAIKQKRDKFKIKPFNS